MKYPIDVEKYIADARIRFGVDEFAEDIYRAIIPLINCAFHAGCDGTGVEEVTAFLTSVNDMPRLRSLYSVLSEWVDAAREQGCQDAQKAVRA